MYPVCLSSRLCVIHGRGLSGSSSSSSSCRGLYELFDLRHQRRIVVEKDVSGHLQSYVFVSLVDAVAAEAAHRRHRGLRRSFTMSSLTVHCWKSGWITGGELLSNIRVNIGCRCQGWLTELGDKPKAK